MLVYYSGFGRWFRLKQVTGRVEIKKKKVNKECRYIENEVEKVQETEEIELDVDPIPKDVAEKIDESMESGLFELSEDDALTLRYDKKVTVHYLYPCYNHKDGVMCNGLTKDEHVVFELLGDNDTFKEPIKIYPGKTYTHEDIVSDTVPTTLELKLEEMKKLVKKSNVSVKTEPSIKKEKVPELSSTVNNLNKKKMKPEKQREFFYKHINILEGNANAKGLSIYNDKNEFKCGAEIMLKSLARKNGSPFKGIKLGTFKNFWKQHLKGLHFCQASEFDESLF